MFLPLSPLDLTALASGTPLEGVRGYATTPSFLASFGLTEADDEDAERTALYVAALEALLRHGVRLVAVAEDQRARDLRDDFGQVETGTVGFDAVSALFSDDEEGRSIAAGVRAELGEAPLAQAWDDPAHERLLAETDLLWHGPAEWDRLTQD